ncbi:MAG: F0F1 ATP synthase subunit B [Rhizobiaceae bacterium]|nr:F0F1 ATP synthase subunit B [Rhizobiaceae bacterium]
MFVTPGYAEEAAPAEGAAHGEDAAQTEGHTEAGGGHASGGFPPFDSSTYPSQILWLAITFGLFYVFLKKVVLPRLGGIIEVRRDRIAQDLEQAARMKEEADAAVAAYEQELTEAKASANTIGQKARDEARSGAEAERKRVEADLDRKLGESEKRIADIKAKALGEVDTIASDTATAIIERLVGGKVDQAAVAAAVKSAKS